MPEILQRPRARADLLEIWFNIAHDNPINADRFLDLISEKLEILSHSPLMGRLRGDIVPSIRSFPVQNYIIYYYPLPNGIDVVRVIHGKRKTKQGQFK